MGTANHKNVICKMNTYEATGLIVMPPIQLKSILDFSARCLFGPGSTWTSSPKYFLVLLINDSEYCQSAGAKPIFKSLLAVFISFPWRAVRPYPTPPPFFWGREVPKKKKIACVGVGALWVVEMFASAWWWWRVKVYWDMNYSLLDRWGGKF